MQLKPNDRECVSGVKKQKQNKVQVCLTLIAECVDGVIYNAVGIEALCFGQQTQQRGNLQPH